MKAGLSFVTGSSLIESEDPDLRGYDFVFVVIALLLLGIDDLFIFDPLRLFCTYSSLLFDCDKCLRLEIVFLCVKHTRLHHCP